MCSILLTRLSSFSDTFALVSVLGLLLVTGPALAQKGDSAEPFIETIDVEVVSLEVYVTDGKGNAVTGLTREDFVLREAGEPVEISNFYAVEGGARLTERFEGIAASKSIGERRPDPLFLTVYVDNIHISPFSRKRTLGQLSQFLKQRVRAGDQVMLASYSGSVRVLQTFTNDWKAIERTLRDLEVMSAGVGLAREDGHKQVIAEILDLHDFMATAGPSAERVAGAGANAACTREIALPAQRYAAQRYEDVERSAAGLGAFVESMASLPGRKAILHVSDGIPRVPGAEVFEFLHRFCSGAGAADGLSEVNDTRFEGSSAYQAQLAQIDATQFDTSALWENLTDKANANGVTFFSLEAYGPRQAGAADATNLDDASTGRGRRVSWAQVDSVRIGNLQDTLNLLAAETGGRAIFNTVDFGDALTKIGGDFDSFYSLGFATPRSVEAQERQVKVAVKQPGLRVRHRKSLRIKPLEEKLADRTLGTLEFGLVDNPLGVQVEIGRTLPLDESLRMVPIRLRIPMANLALLPQEASRHGRLSVYLAARDRRGWRAPVRNAEVPIAVPENEVATIEGRDYVYEVKMLMRDGTHSLAVGVRDEIGSVASYLVEDVVVRGR